MRYKPVLFLSSLLVASLTVALLAERPASAQSGEPVRVVLHALPAHTAPTQLAQTGQTQTMSIPADTDLPGNLLARGPRKADGSPAAWTHAGVIIQDAGSGQTLLRWHDTETFTPASNMKLLTTSAALYTLGPDHRFGTTALGSLQSGRVDTLTLRGSGDPMLNVSGPDSLTALAGQIAKAGVKTVGTLQVDDSALSWPRWGNGWMWDDTEFPIGALHLEGDGAPYGQLVVSDKERQAGVKPNPELMTDANVLPLQVGARFRSALIQAGVQVTGSPVLGQAGKTDTALASIQSEPLSDILRDTNKESVNIHAEQLLAALGIGADGTPSTHERSEAVISGFIKKVGYAGSDFRLADGSGLSRYDLLTPDLLAALLRYVYLHPVTADGQQLSPQDAWKNHANVLIESLPVLGSGVATPADAARGGTLAKRLVDSGLDVRAKTGSMTGVSSISGYVQAKSGRVVSFSILMDNYSGPLSDLTRWQDEIVQAIAARY